MCGRYTYYSSEYLLKEYDINDDKSKQLAMQIPDNFNVAPGGHMPVIVRGGQSHKVEFMIWGLITSWSDNPDQALKLINARMEGLHQKPMWKRLIKSKRCVVPARGFYEWKAEQGVKQPYYITPKQGSVFSFAGLWDVWQDAHGTEMVTYTIITTKPNREMKTIHSRMPAILSKKAMDRWLEPVDLSQDEIEDLLKQQDNTLQITKVSTKVNNTRNNSEDLIYSLN